MRSPKLIEFAPRPADPPTRRAHWLAFAIAAVLVTLAGAAAGYDLALGNLLP